MRVFFTSNAEVDLREISAWIADDSPVEAVRFASELRAKALSIGERARIYPFVVGHEADGIRRCLHKGYLIFYWIADGQVEILHLLNSARDYLSLLAADDQTNE